MRMIVTAIGKGVLLFGVDNPGVIKAQWSKILVAAGKRCIWAWWEYFMPNHFRSGSRSKYPGAFAKRSRITEAKKYKRYGHSLPLVNYPEGQPPSGRDTLEGFLRIPPMVTATATHAVGRWNAKGVHQKYIDEATATSTNDELVLAKLFKDVVIKLLGSGEAQGVQNGPRSRSAEGNLNRTRRRVIR